MVGHLKMVSSLQSTRSIPNHPYLQKYEFLVEGSYLMIC